MRISSLLLVALVFVRVAPHADAGSWVSWDEFCNDMNQNEGKNWDCSEGPLVRDGAVFPNWAGEVISLYGEPDRGVVRYEIKITWVTSKSPFRCGSTIKMHPSEVKEFTHRSIAMRRCS